MAMISCHNLSKAYGTHWAVRNLELRVPRGSICALVGPNGAGKSSTIKMMATLLEPTAGRIIIDGLDVSTAREAVRRTIGYLPDHFSLYENLTVAECLDFYGSCYEVPRKVRVKRIGELLEQLDLVVKRDEKIEGLSRGMKQRVGIARALLHDPPVLLLDEPASGLDPAARIMLRQLLVELKNKGKTILVSSHVLTELNTFCDALAILQQGRVLESGRLDEVQERLGKGRLPYTLILHSGIEVATRLLEGEPEVADLTVAGERCDFTYAASPARAAALLAQVVGAGAAVIGMERGKQDLEWVYRSISRDEVN